MPALSRVAPHSPFAGMPARRPIKTYEVMYFAEQEVWRFDREETVTRDRWLDLLPTTGGLTRLRPDQVTAVLDAVGSAIDALGGRFMLELTMLAVSATRRTG